jgi:nitrogen fixation NifU-like protein
MPNLQYSKELLKHFRNPHNQGSIDNPDGVGEVGNPVCGDMMKIYIKVDKNSQNEEYISDIKFETLGCASAIATSSMVTDLAHGKTINEALKITKADVSSKLGGLPPIKEHCSNLSEAGLKAAIEDYQSKK